MTFKDPSKEEINQEDIDKLNWAEAAGLENLRCHLKSIDDLAHESQFTLTIILAGIGFAFKYIIDDINTHVSGLSSIGVGLACFIVFLIGVGVLLTFKCLKIGGAPSPTNEPLHLYKNSDRYFQAKQKELVGINNRIKDAIKRNKKTARWLNWLRAATTLSPFVFFIVYLIVRCSSSCV